MKLPEIPTDNLYKFMALSGLTLIILSFLPHLHIHKLNVNLIRLEGEAETLEKEVEWTSSDLKKLHNEIEGLKARIAELTGVSASEITAAFGMGRSFSDILKEKEVEVEKHSKELDELCSKQSDYVEMQRKQAVRAIQIQTKIREHKQLVHMVAREVYLLIAASVCGLFLAIFGFVLWYRKLQLPQDTIISNRAKNVPRE